MQRSLCTFVVAVAVSLPATPAAAQQFTGTPPVAAFADPVPLRLTVRQLRDGVPIRVQRADSTVRLRFGIDDRGEVRPLSRLLAIDSPVVEFVNQRDAVQPHHDLWLRLRRDTMRAAATLPSGVYRGAVTIADASGRIGARREVEVRVPGIEPFAEGWRADIFKLSILVEERNRWFPWGELRCDVGRASQAACVRDNVLPLRIPDGVPDPGTRARDTIVDLRHYELLGALEHAEGDHGLVWWTREPLRGDSSRAGMVLHFTSFDVPGTYRGKLALGSTADAAVEMAVRVTHDWPLPILFLVAGIALSWLLQRYVRSRRAALMLDSDIGRLLHRIHIVDERLIAADSQRPGALPYRMPDQMRWEIMEAEQRLRRATRLRRAEEAQEAMTKAKDTLTAQEAEIVRWERFADALNHTADALPPARAAAGAIHRPGMPPEPVLIGRGEALLAGRMIAGEDLDAVRIELEEVRSLLQSWTEVAGRFAETTSAPSDAAPILWQAAGQAEIAAASALLTEAGAPAPAGPYTAKGGAGVLLRAEVAAAERASAARVWLPRPIFRESTLLDRIRRAEKWEVANAVGYQAITFIVVALTGLSQVYFGQEAFGSAADYLEAFLWGFSGKLGIDLARDALNTREFPWPKWPNRQGSADPAQQPPAPVA